MEFPVSINVKSVNVGNDTFMYDGDTGFLTKSTGLLNDVLDYISCSTREEIVDALREKYGEEEIIGCLQNIETLYNQKKLFDREKKAVMRSPEAYQKDWEAGNLLVNLWLNVSHDCNLRCIYCFGHGGSYGGTRELMSIDTAKKSIDYWFKYLNKNIPMTTVTFFGGEPLMNLEVIKFSINYVNKLLEEYDIRVQYIITTNGTIFNDEIIELFMKNDVQFAISIDGGQAIQDRNRPYASGKGSFEIIKKNVAIEEVVKCAFEHPGQKNIPNNVKQLINIEKNTRKCLEQSKPFDDFINSIQINMINACNMRCKYCFADGGSHHKNGVMDEKQAKRVIDYVFEHIEGNLLSVVIIGGEPMLNIPVFEYILHYCKKKALEKNISVRFATTTNGTLFDASNLQLLDSYNVMAMISQDSCDKNINDYLRSMANGRQSQYEIIQRKKQLLLGQQKKRAAHITITPFNKNFAQTAISFYEEGFYHVHLDFVKSEVAEFLFSETDIAIIKEQVSRLGAYIS